MRIESIAIGSELLETDRVDTNSAWMALKLADLGLTFSRKTLVGDDPGELRAIFQETLDRSDVVLCTGGLGPTFDDLTKEIWAEVLGDTLEEDGQILFDIQERFRSRNWPFSENNRKQAFVPRGGQALKNPVGTAPGIYWDLAPGRLGPHRKQIFLFPGVPREMETLWQLYADPLLRDLAGKTLHTLRLLVGGVGEGALDERLTPLRKKHDQLEWTILCHQSLVEMRARSDNADLLRQAEGEFVAELGQDLVCVGEDSLEATLVALLKSRQETLAVCESMTGGRAAALVTGVAGSSAVFLGGPVVYTPRAKQLYGGLTADFIDQHGTVSEETTRALAERTKTLTGATWVLAITGNAGPTVDEHSLYGVGTVFIAVAGPGKTACLRVQLAGERPIIQIRSAYRALDFLRRQIVYH